MFSMILSAAVLGVEARPVQVEADVCDGLPMFCMVGDLSPEVREAADRVRTALKNTGIQIPPKRITVNLSPADIRKQGTRYDLPVAAALLAAFGILPEEFVRNVMVVGELGLNGQVYPVGGVLQTVLLAKKTGMRCCLVPEEKCRGRFLIRGIDVVGIGSMKDLLECLLSEYVLPGADRKVQTWVPGKVLPGEDFREVNGQAGVDVLRKLRRRACIIS